MCACVCARVHVCADRHDKNKVQLFGGPFTTIAGIYVYIWNYIMHETKMQESEGNDKTVVRLSNASSRDKSRLWNL